MNTIASIKGKVAELAGIISTLSSSAGPKSMVCSAFWVAAYGDDLKNESAVDI
jgi:hypothetical protein